jgi:hypothetical protein
LGEGADPNRPQAARNGRTLVAPELDDPVLKPPTPQPFEVFGSVPLNTMSGERDMHRKRRFR